MPLPIDDFARALASRQALEAQRALSIRGKQPPGRRQVSTFYYPDKIPA